MTEEAKNTALAEKIDSGGKAELTREDKQYWRIMLDQQQSQFAEALTGTGIDPKHFKRVALTAIRSNPMLQDADFISLMGAIMTTAQLGLEPSGPLGQAYLIPFKNNKEKRIDVQLILGYQGLIELAYRSGRVMSIIAHTVCKEDYFEWELGTNERIIHRPAEGNRGELVGAYAIAKLAGGGQVFDYMTRAEIEARRDRSKGAGSDHSPWKTDYEAMARKTAVRQLFKWLPASVAVSAALGADSQSFREIPGSADDIVDVIDVESDEV
jgi:recombination protein RecT